VTTSRLGSRAGAAGATGVTGLPGAPLDLVGRSGKGPRQAAAWSARQVIVTNLRAIRGRAYPRIRAMFREKSWLIFEITLPFLQTAAFVFVYRSLHAPEAYVGFVVLGGVMSAFWVNIIWMMANQLWWEKSQGNLELYFAAPMDFMAILFGMAIGGMAMSSSRALAILVIATLVFGVSFSVSSWILVILVFAATMAALYGVGMVLASLFLVWGREAWHLGQMLTEPVYFISGLNFPVARLGLLGGLSVGLIPLATGLDAMRQLVFAGAPFPFGTPAPIVELGILVAMAIISTSLARWMLAIMEKRAREEGRLTIRWQ
jgi:ABC-2 type transport system permease protein